MELDNWTRRINIGAVVSLTFLLVGIWFLAAPELSYAHQCVADADESSEEALLRYFEEYDSVFMGRVTDSWHEDPNPEDAEIIADGVARTIHTFEVTGVFKGRVYKTVHLATSSGFGGVYYNDTYLIFADAPEFFLGLCNPSSTIDRNEDRYIRRGKDYFGILRQMFPDGPVVPTKDTSPSTPTPIPTFTATPMPTSTVTATSTSIPTRTPKPAPPVTPTEVSVSPTIPPAHTPNPLPTSSDTSGCGLSAATDLPSAALMLGIVALALRARRW